MTDSGDIILKVKSKWLNVADDLEPLANYKINRDFCAYSLDTDNGTLKGYYIKIVKIKIKTIHFTVDFNNGDNLF